MLFCRKPVEVSFERRHHVLINAVEVVVNAFVFGVRQGCGFDFKIAAGFVQVFPKPGADAADHAGAVGAAFLRAADGINREAEDVAYNLAPKRERLPPPETMIFFPRVIALSGKTPR